MKNIIFLFLILCSLNMLAQSGYEKDTVIAGLQKKIPAGWTIKYQDTLIIIARNKPVYRVRYSKDSIYASGHDTATTDNDKPPTGSEKFEMKCEIVISMPRWSNSKYLKVKRYDDSLDNEQNMLKTQLKNGGTVYGQLVDSSGGVIKHGDTAVDRFNHSLWNEIQKLNESEIRIPPYCSQYFFFDFFVIDCYRIMKNAHAYYKVFPYQAVRELNEIQQYVDYNWDTCKAYH